MCFHNKMLQPILYNKKNWSKNIYAVEFAHYSKNISDSIIPYWATNNNVTYFDKFSPPTKVDNMSKHQHQKKDKQNYVVGNL